MKIIKYTNVCECTNYTKINKIPRERQIDSSRGIVQIYEIVKPSFSSCFLIPESSPEITRFVAVTVMSG